MKASYVQIVPIKCDSCGEMVMSLSDKSQWFGKYLRDGEERICYNCIKDREGYAEEYLEKIGVSLSERNLW